MNVSFDCRLVTRIAITLAIENRPNDWHNEWAYWNHVFIVSE
ncbi:MAG TPA: hypothetical protein QF564_30535 [Pirellulaceae bacterium]|jgi:hypothetical protein|nr:hypothetical protein [Pirellulaceae bacterium]